MSRLKLLLIGLFLLLAHFAIAHPAWGIIMDEQGNFYFADIGHHERGTLWRLSASGKLTALLKDFHAHNVVLDARGNIISAHGEDHHTLVRLWTSGEMDTLLTTTDLDEFYGGNWTRSVNGNIYFCLKHHVWKIGLDGQKTKHSPLRLEWNQAIFVDAEENIYVPDIGQGNGTLFKIKPDGSYHAIARDLIEVPAGREKDPHADILQGMAKDSEGNVYIADLGGRRIVQIGPNMTTKTFYRSASGHSPSGICFDGRTAYVLEDGPRIVKVSPNGHTKILFDYNAPKSIEKEEEDWWVYTLLIGFLALFVYLGYRDDYRRDRKGFIDTVIGTLSSAVKFIFGMR